MNTVDSGDTDDCSIFNFNLRVDVGAGWQCTVSYINNGCYYIVGLPLGILLGFVFDIGAMVKETAKNVDEAVRELPDANKKPQDLWKNHSKVVHPKPHRKNSPSWSAIQKILDSGEEIGLKHFKPMKRLGSADTGREKCSILLGCN